MKRKNKSKAPKGSLYQEVTQKELLLSVIIPAYNLEEDIALCLDSVLAQDLKEMEILVVDNGSQDGTAETLRRYAEKDPRIKPIYLEKNRMPSGARNAALDVAQGKYVHFCDGDDMVPKGAYRELLRVAEAENAEVVTGNYSRKYPAEGGVIREFSHYQAQTGFERCFESGNTTLWNKIFRRTIIEKLHLRFSMELRHSEDFLFYLQVLLQNPKVAYTDKSVYIYTEPYGHNESDESNSEIRYASVKCMEDGTYVYKKIFAQPITHHEEIWFACFCQNIDWHLQCSWRLIQDPEQRKEAFKILQEALKDVQKTTTICDWTKDNHMQRFVEIMGTDFFTFASMRYEDYMFLFLNRRGIRPRKAKSMIIQKTGQIQNENKDDILTSSAKEILEDIHKAYSHEIENAKQIWKSHYYTLIDSVLNDYWRQIISRELKEELYKYLQNFVKMMKTQNALCAINTEEDLERFQQIFCVDYAGFQTFSYTEYMLLCSTGSNGYCGSTGEKGDREGYHMPQPLEYYVAACRNGQLGMRGIIKGFMAWLKYKLNQ